MPSGFKTTRKLYMSWTEYERRKAVIVSKNLPQPLFEKAMRQLVRELGL